MANGELRFRLLTAEGGGYILTRSPAGGWQQSHFHVTTTETYIVQSGWVAFATPGADGEAAIRIARPGDIFTVQPGVIHNIYMARDAIIHTVKHGMSSTGDRKTDERTRAFDAVLSGFDETRTLAGESDPRGSPAPTPAYGEEYRHFDNLIWQAPAWASAIFALSLQGLDSEVQAGFTRAGLPSDQALFGFWSLMSAALFCFSFVLWRFRCHQAGLKVWRTPWYRSASTYTQLLITAQSGALMFLAGVAAGLAPPITALVCAGLTLAITSLFEVRLRNRRRLPAA
jgi:hypothetical protein